jgi:hypothetical protein
MRKVIFPYYIGNIVDKSVGNMTQTSSSSSTPPGKSRHISAYSQLAVAQPATRNVTSYSVCACLCLYIFARTYVLRSVV